MKLEKNEENIQTVLKRVGALEVKILNKEEQSRVRHNESWLKPGKTQTRVQQQHTGEGTSPFSSDEVIAEL